MQVNHLDFNDENIFAGIVARNKIWKVAIQSNDITF
jgi:hypothetical protein